MERKYNKIGKGGTLAKDYMADKFQNYYFPK